MRWWSARDILEGAGFHPALKQAVLDWNLARRRLSFLRSTTASAPHAASALALARAMAVAASRPARLSIRFDAGQQRYAQDPPEEAWQVAAAVAAVYSGDDDTAADGSSRNGHGGGGRGRYWLAVGRYALTFLAGVSAGVGWLRRAQRRT